jgi:hypothetical protein
VVFPLRLCWGLAAPASGWAGAGAGAGAGIATGAGGGGVGATASGAGATTGGAAASAGAGLSWAGASWAGAAVAGCAAVSAWSAAGALAFFRAADAVPPEASRAVTRTAAESRRGANRMLGDLVVLIGEPRWLSALPNHQEWTSGKQQRRRSLYTNSPRTGKAPSGLEHWAARRARQDPLRSHQAGLACCNAGGE